MLKFLLCLFLIAPAFAIAAASDPLDDGIRQGTILSSPQSKAVLCCTTADHLMSTRVYTIYFQEVAQCTEKEIGRLATTFDREHRMLFADLFIKPEYQQQKGKYTAHALLTFFQTYETKPYSDVSYHILSTPQTVKFYQQFQFVENKKEIRRLRGSQPNIFADGKSYLTLAKCPVHSPYQQILEYFNAKEQRKKAGGKTSHTFQLLKRSHQAKLAASNSFFNPPAP